MDQTIPHIGGSVIIDEKIENKQLGRNRWDVYDEMQERAKKLAGKLLKEHFPEIRQKADMKEKAAVRKSKGMKM